MPPNLTPPAQPAPRTGRPRRIAAALATLIVIGLGTVPAHPAAALPTTTAPVAHAGQGASTTPTSEALAGTTLEADSRDEGTAVAPWLLWSGIAAGASVLVGGLLLKRRMT